MEDPTFAPDSTNSVRFDNAAVDALSAEQMCAISDALSEVPGRWFFGQDTEGDGSPTRYRELLDTMLKGATSDPLTWPKKDGA